MGQTAYRAALGLLGAAAFVSAGLSATPASASTPAKPASCSYWNPANNFHGYGDLAGGSVAIFSQNNAQSCVIGHNYGSSDPIDLFCMWTNPANHSQTWFYLYDELSLVRGWVAGSNVRVIQGVGAC